MAMRETRDDLLPRLPRGEPGEVSQLRCSAVIEEEAEERNVLSSSGFKVAQTGVAQSRQQNVGRESE